MRAEALSLRGFRTYEHAACSLGTGLTVIWGPNGSGKTNLLEALYVGCTGRSCRTPNDRELVRFGSDATRVELRTADTAGGHRITVAYAPGQPKRMQIDGSPVERLLDASERPLVSVFLPDRLDLVKGAPSLRRAHLDQFVAALWPARAQTRRSYAHALAQRNALLTRIKAGFVAPASLDAWDQRLAQCGYELMTDRSAALDAMAETFADTAGRLALDGTPSVAYRPRSHADTQAGLLAELAERRDADIERGYSGHGPHRDDLVLKREGRELSKYGSQGQQRLALLALLLAEREVIAERRQRTPLLLLDDVMSELDGARRSALVELLSDTPGQVVITATDLEHVPGAEDPAAVRIHVADGQLTQTEETSLA
ncbi:MAG: DNA replication and repair protein RecF [Solirubrobacterales bacterium]|nr:DNA replication and repair protein RecF [Solirubrobacterales bacterium]